MKSPPAARPETQEPLGLVPGGTQAGVKIRVINPPWNGSGRIKRKIAKSYVDEGRAGWSEGPRDKTTGKPELVLRMVESHSKYKAAKRRAAAGYDETDWEGRRVTPAELLHIGVVCPEKAIEESVTLRTGPAQRHLAGRSGPVRRITSAPGGNSNDSTKPDASTPK